MQRSLNNYFRIHRVILYLVRYRPVLLGSELLKSLVLRLRTYYRAQHILDTQFLLIEELN